MEIVGFLNKDAMGYYQALTESLTERGILQPGQSASPAAPAKPFALPRASHRSEDGEEFFSAKQMNEIVNGVLSEVDNRVKPFASEAADRRAAAAETERVAAVNQKGDDLVAELKTLPHYETFRKEMAATLSEMAPERRAALGGTPGALFWIYNQLVNSKVLPNAASDAEKRVREDLAKKANASRGSVSPSNATPAPAAPVLRNQRDLARHMQSMADGVTRG